MTSRSERPHIDQRAVDVWAMGVILYLLVTGTYPFEDPDQPECFVQVFKNIRRCNIRPLPLHVSEGCRDLMRSIFEMDPKKRIGLVDLEKNPWLIEQSKTYAEGIKPLIQREKPTPAYSVKNLMLRLPTHEKQVLQILS